MSNPNCDGSGPHDAGETRALPIGGGAHVILCKRCHASEIAWRIERNAKVAYPFDLPKWEELQPEAS